MGKWAKNLFGKERLGEVGLVVAGSISPEREKELLKLFDKVVFTKESAFHAHMVKKEGAEYPFVTNVYGAPAMLDVLTQMHDGGCNNVVFIGWAYGVAKQSKAGDIVIPDKAFHFDGVYHPLQPDKKFDVPDKELKQVLEGILKKQQFAYSTGNHVSVPSVSFQLPHANKEYQKIRPLTIEMELAACLSRSKEIGMRAIGILVISDTRSTSIISYPKKIYEERNKIVKTIVNNFNKFRFPPLPVKKRFSIDEHMASIIHDPDDKTNVYKKG